MESYALQVEHLQKTYGHRCVVKDVSFNIRKGTCYGLLGHNGAGKSTTIDCILQVKKADQGNVILLNQVLDKRDRRLFQRIGVQFQESGYPSKLKVYEACALQAAMYPQAADIASVLKEFHLEHVKKQDIQELSGGERQRLSILLAMLSKPEFLCLDELTTGLDTVARREIWGYIQTFKAQGNSVLLTSHYMDEVEVLCDEIGILKEGVMIFQGSVEQAKQVSGCQYLEEAYLWFMQEENI